MWFANFFEAIIVKPIMKTLVEIQDAVAHLSFEERKVLQMWLNSQNEPRLTAGEEQQLLQSLDRAVSDIDGGQGVPINDLYRRITSWAVK